MASLNQVARENNGSIDMRSTTDDNRIRDFFNLLLNNNVIEPTSHSNLIL